MYNTFIAASNLLDAGWIRWDKALHYSRALLLHGPIKAILNTKCNLSKSDDHVFLGQTVTIKDSRNIALATKIFAVYCKFMRKFIILTRNRVITLWAQQENHHIRYAMVNIVYVNQSRPAAHKPIFCGIVKYFEAWYKIHICCILTGVLRSNMARGARDGTP